jgi:hypothetical protein
MVSMMNITVSGSEWALGAARTSFISDISFLWDAKFGAVVCYNAKLLS